MAELSVLRNARWKTPRHCHGVLLVTTMQWYVTGHWLLLTLLTILCTYSQYLEQFTKWCCRC